MGHRPCSRSYSFAGGMRSVLQLRGSVRTESKSPGLSYDLRAVGGMRTEKRSSPVCRSAHWDPSPALEATETEPAAFSGTLARTPL